MVAPLKIALLAFPRHPVAEPYAGGLEAHTHLLARGLREAGHRVTLFAHHASDVSFPVTPYAPAPLNFFGDTRSVASALRVLRSGGYDIVHNNSSTFLPPLFAGRLPMPVVTTLHTPPYRSHRWTAAWSRQPPRHTYVSISHHLQEVWAPLIGASTVIYNGIKPASEGGHAATVHPKEKSAIWFGRIHPTKGTHLAILACREAGYALEIAGPVGDDRYFTEQVAPLLDDRIRYVGHLRQSDLVVKIAAATIGLITPTWEEPFGLVAAEMLACGTPVAAFDSGALREILTEDCSEIVPAPDYLALAAVLDRVARKSRQAAKSRAAEFSASAMVSHYLSLYQRTILSFNK